jgi:hypothetical protein
VVRPRKLRGSLPATVVAVKGGLDPKSGLIWGLARHDNVSSREWREPALYPNGDTRCHVLTHLCKSGVFKNSNLGSCVRARSKREPAIVHDRQKEFLWAELRVVVSVR